MLTISGIHVFTFSKLAKGIVTFRLKTDIPDSQWYSLNLGLIKNSQWYSLNLGLIKDSQWYSLNLGLIKDSQWYSSNLGLIRDYRLFLISLSDMYVFYTTFKRFEVKGLND